MWVINIKGEFLDVFSWKPPEHLFYFNARNMRMMLDNLSFQTLRLRTYWVCYRLSDLFYRLAQFSSIPVFDWIGKLIKKTAVLDVFLKIPTNEMLVIARKK